MSISSITSNTTARIAAGVVGIALAFTLAFAQPAHAAALSETQIQAIISLLQSFGADSATVANVNASLRGQATTGTGSTSGSSSSCSVLSRDLQVGSTGADVMALQKFLNANGAVVAASGAGSAGMETSTFGPATKAAVMKFQTANGISPVSGYVGPMTRAKINSMCGSTTTNPNPTTPSAGTGLSVMAAAQPANGLAPATSMRIPFTNFTVTAGNDGDVTITGVTVERTGPAVDSNFSGVVLLDQATGMQVGISKTLNSNHQATIGDTVTVPRGTSKTFTVAANRSTAGSRGGEVASFAVVSINTTATVSGSLPITGASHTINETLTVGTMSTSTSSFDPGAAQSKSIGDTNVRFSGIRFTAGSGEDVKLYSIRFRQVGSVTSGDLANVVANINGTEYPTTVDSTGKYYSVSIPGGLMVAKGNSVDVYVKGDLVGSSSAGRTVDFDIDKNTDVYFVGQLYGYGIGFNPNYTNTPWMNGYVTTILAGTATTIGKATEVPAQNVAVSVQNQPLGGFVADIKGEAVSVGSMAFTVSTTTGNTWALTNVTLVDENGTVIAGPVDQSGTTITFSDNPTLKVGRHVYTLKGKLSSATPTGTTFSVSTTISSQWSNIVGQTSGNSISSFSGSFTMNTMTVKGATLSVAMSSTPSAASIVAGGQSITFGNLQLDASQSGEDVRISQVKIRFTYAGSATDLTSCQVYNGSTPLNTGSNVPTSLSSTGTATTFTFDNPLTVAKGTVMTLPVKCNVSSGATGSFTASVNSGDDLSPTGVTSGVSVSESVSNTSAGAQTIASGSLTVTSSGSAVTQPSLTPVAAGTAGVTLGNVKVSARNEGVNLTKMGLTLTNSSTGSTATANGGSSNSGINDLVTVYIYNGATQVGTATFTGSGTTATSTFSTPVSIASNADVILTIKGDMAQIGAGLAGGIGDKVVVDPLNAEGTGQSSGSTLAVSATSGTSGVYLFQSYPIVASTVSGCSNTSSNNCNGANSILKKFTVSAANSTGGRGIGLYTVNLSLATSSAAVTAVKLYAYTDAGYSQGLSSQGSGTGQVGSTCTPNSSTPTCTFTASTVIQIGAGQTMYFALLGTVAPSASQWNVTATLSGDSAAPTIFTSGYKMATATASSLGNFIWSDNASTSAATTDVDWTNGYQVPGLPSSGL